MIASSSISTRYSIPPRFSLFLFLLICSLAMPVESADNSTAQATAVPENGNQSLDQPSANDSLPQGRWERIADLPRSINEIIADPSNPGVFYAGAGEQGSGSGVYKSEDYGLTWKRASSGLPNEDVNSLFISSDSSHRLFASLFVSATTHIYSSDDGGESWNLLSNTGIFGGLKQRLVGDPKSSENQFLILDGLFRSRDGGRNWQPINEGLPQDPNFDHGAYVLTVAIDPNDSQIVYAGTGSIGGQGNGVFRSNDGGMTWLPSNKGMLDYRISALKIDPTDSKIVYAGAEKGELFKSTNAGLSWNDTSDRDIMDMFSSPEILDIFVDPSNPKTVYVLAEEAGILLSRDAGSSWIKLGRPEILEEPLRFTAMAVVAEPLPIVIIGVDPYIKNAGAWRFASSSI
jgi:photosystem II stability/assembly factor-like uncharacterized protein